MAGETLTIEEVLDTWSFAEGASPTRPHLILNMICTADGRATIAGRSGPIGGAADGLLFHGLRTLVDAVIIGAQTLRIERYSRIVADPVQSTRRLRRGLAEEALACVVSTSLALDPQLPLLADPRARVAILTQDDRTLPPTAARVVYVRERQDGRLDLPACMKTLRERFAVRTMLCEGGPHLARQLLGSGLLDEVCLTIAPKLVAGRIGSEDADSGVALSILSGAALDPPAQLDLFSVLESDSYLFLRYRISR
jgi:riboflavin biosynthesis pyrimidine reductase